MTWVTAAGLMHRLRRRWLLDLGVVVLSSADAVGSTVSDDDHHITVFRASISVVAVLALLVRERAPYLAFVLTVPALAITGVVIASLVALFTVAQRRPMDWRVVGCAVAEFIGYTSLWDDGYHGIVTVLNTAYAVVVAAAPVWLGLLITARAALSDKLIQIEQVRQHENALLVERALALERAALAREMHDVVSHQVSLIAVQAGALQVTTCDDAAVQAARTLRTLAVRTLDELREMLSVLRPTTHGEPPLAPQPRIADIADLIARSGVVVTVTQSRDADSVPSAAVERATYRTVQEGLTNVAKHSPGATVQLDLDISVRMVTIRVTNSAAVDETHNLPSTGHGLIGLRERAELLGGTLSAEHLPRGGFRLTVLLPTHSP